MGKARRPITASPLSPNHSAPRHPTGQIPGEPTEAHQPRRDFNRAVNRIIDSTIASCSCLGASLQIKKKGGGRLLEEGLGKRGCASRFLDLWWEGATSVYRPGRSPSPFVVCRALLRLLKKHWLQFVIFTIFSRDLPNAFITSGTDVVITTNNANCNRFLMLDAAHNSIAACLTSL